MRYALRLGVFLIVHVMALQVVHATPITTTSEDVEETVPELFGGPRVGQSSMQLSNIRRELTQVLDSFQKEDYDRSLNLLNAAAKKYPQLPPARLMLARLFIQNNQLAMGRAALEQAAAENPAYPGTYVTFGELALSQGRLTDAMLHFEKAKSLSEDERWTLQQHNLYKRIYADLAVIATQRSDWLSAKTYFWALLELEPENGSVRQQLAQVLFELGEPDLAYEELRKAVTHDLSLEPAAISMGRLYSEKGQLPEAAEWIKQAIEHNPDDARAYRALASLLLRQGDAAGAKTQVDIAAELDPGSKETEVLRGLIARYLKDYTHAEAIFEALHKESPADSSVNNQLALVLVEQPVASERQRALHLAETNASLFPHSSEALATLGWVYYRLGRLDEAESALRAAMSSGVASPDGAYYLARVAFDRNRPEEVRRLLTTALDTPGTFLFRKEARELLERVREKS